VKRAEKKKNWISEQYCVQAASACNLCCACCQNPPGAPAPPLARALAVIRRRGIKAVSLEGSGEPTVNPDFFENIKKLRAAGVEHFMLSTNAVTFSDKTFCARAAREVDSFTVNFPSHLPAVYARATRSVRFARALRGLRNLKACGAEGRTRLFVIVSAFNYSTLPAYADWAAKNFGGAELVNLTFVRNAGRVADDPAVMPSYSEAAPFIRLALAKFKLAGLKAVAQNVPLCQLGGFEGFSFEFQRWLRGDKVLEEGVAGAARCAACSRCRLRPACCGARADYARVRGLGELKASDKDPASVRPERF